ncbi:MAG: NEL domain-containing protein [Donghicola eburneus]|nr:hypothetical protein [Donghicola eburneus]MCI5040534.1 NEL domain-containing protein [Donghicola eburneus]
MTNPFRVDFPSVFAVIISFGLLGYIPKSWDWFWLHFSYILWCLAVIIAWLALQDENHRRRVGRFLRHRRYTHVYQVISRFFLTRVWRWLCDQDVSERAKWSAQAQGALTAKLYDKALLFAVVYPIFAAVGYWLWTGNAATIGSAEIIRAEPNQERLFALAPIATLILFICLKHHFLINSRRRQVSFTSLQTKIIENLELIGLFIAVAVASGFRDPVAFAILFAGAFAGAFDGAISLTVALVFAGASAIELAGSLEGAIAVAVTAAFARAFKELQPIHLHFLSLHIIFMCALVSGLVWYIPWIEVSDDRKSLFVFLGIFPLINGVFDWISYGVTLSLLRRGQSEPWPFLWGLLDLIVACALFLLLGITLVAVLHGLDQLAGGALVDLPALLNGVGAMKDGDWSQSWALFMVFSTMVPTGLHVLISLIGLQGFLPAPLRRKLAGWIEVDDPSPLSQALLPMVLGVVWAAPIVAGCAVIWALIQSGKPLLGGFFKLYFDFLMCVAQWGGVV